MNNYMYKIKRKWGIYQKCNSSKVSPEIIMQGWKKAEEKCGTESNCKIEENLNKI